MNYDISIRIEQMIKDCDTLQEEYEKDPFHSDLIAAEGAIVSADALIAEADREPEDMAPEKIMEMKLLGENSKEIAAIALRQAKSKREQYFSFLRGKILEAREDALAILNQVREAFEGKIEAAVIELAGGYYSEYAVGWTEPKAIAKHRGKLLRRHEMTLKSDSAFQDQPVGINHIRKAMEVAKQHLG